MFKTRIKKSIISIMMCLFLVGTTALGDGIFAEAQTKAAKKITLNYTKTTTSVGCRMNLKVSRVTPAGASKKVTWSSSNNKIATVNSKGIVRAKKTGKVTITAKASKKVKAQCKITVYKAAKKIKLTCKKSYKKYVGDRVKVSAKVTSPTRGAEPIKWTSKNTKVVKVGSKGVVTCVGAGKTTITGTSGKKTVKIYFTVKKKSTSSTTQTTQTTQKITTATTEKSQVTTTAKPPVTTTTTEKPTVTTTEKSNTTTASTEQPTGTATTGTEKPTEEENVVAFGKSNNIDWKVTQEGQLLLNGTGDYATIKVTTDGDFVESDFVERNVPAWYNYRDYITSAKVNIQGITTTENMFFGCYKMKNIELSDLDTSKVINMACMFACCENVTKLDLSNFKTGLVTDMNRMFFFCPDLETINLTSFDTEKVTNMEKMFCFCENLKSLDIGIFNTEDVLNMDYMFYCCSNLSKLDVSNFDTSKLSSMINMFAYCEKISQLDVSNFATGNVTDFTNMFSGCSNLQNLDLMKWNTENAINMNGMFKNCNGITELDLSNFNTGKVVQMSNMFYNCTNLTSVNVSAFDVTNVSNVAYMFEDCSSLININLGNWHAENLTYIDGIFRRCSSLKSIDLSGLDLSSIKPVFAEEDDITIFGECDSLTEIKCPLKLNRAIQLPESDNYVWIMDGDNQKYLDSLPENLEESVLLKALDGNTITLYSGSSNQIEWKITASKKLYVSGSGDYELNGEAAPWCEYDSIIKSADIQITDITSTKGMFYNCEQLTTVNISGLDTGFVTDMSKMFYGCSNIKELDLSSLNMTNVENTIGMFKGCASLYSINFTGLKSEKIRNAGSMFADCKYIGELDLSGFDFSVLESAGLFFDNCSWLYEIKTPLNLKIQIELPEKSGYWIDLVDDPSLYTKLPMGCNQTMRLQNNETIPENVIISGKSNQISWEIKNGNLTVTGTGDFEDEYVNSRTTPWEKFKLLVKTADLNVSGMTTAECLFYNCENLVSLDVSKFDTSQITNMDSIFCDCKSLLELDLSSWNLSKLEYADNMFEYCEKLKNIKTPLNLQKEIGLPEGESDDTAKYWMEKDNNNNILWNTFPLKASASTTLIAENYGEMRIDDVKSENEKMIILDFNHSEIEIELDECIFNGQMQDALKVTFGKRGITGAIRSDEDGWYYELTETTTGLIRVYRIYIETRYTKLKITGMTVVHPYVTNYWYDDEELVFEIDHEFQGDIEEIFDSVSFTYGDENITGELKKNTKGSWPPYYYLITNNKTGVTRIYFVSI